MMRVSLPPVRSTLTRSPDTDAARSRRESSREYWVGAAKSGRDFSTKEIPDWGETRAITSPESFRMLGKKVRSKLMFLKWRNSDTASGSSWDGASPWKEASSRKDAEIPWSE